MAWFAVDRKGLATVVERYGKAFVVHEMVQNAWDEDVTRADVTLDPMPGKRGLCRLTVEDDSPDGFHDLSHAYTMFAPSKKKADATKRGLFNVGEKLVLAQCRSARVTSTKGSIIFRPDGTRVSGRKRRDAGTIFEAEIHMTQAEYEEVVAAVDKLIVPPDIVTTFNGRVLRSRTSIASFEATLPTVIADAEGNLRRTARKTKVDVYEVRAGEEAAIYEMGIPVVVTGDKYHVDVQQKVPVNIERNSVPPSFLQTVRVFTANATADLWDREDAASKWVQAATSDERCEGDTFERMATLRFGEKRAAFDLSDPEANSSLTSSGYSVLSGGTFNKDQWANAKRYGAVKPSGHIRPTPKPYSEHGTPETLIPPEEWTEDMRWLVNFAKGLADHLMGVRISVRIAREPRVWWRANYGGCSLCLNYSKLGKRWFSAQDIGEVVRLLIHEFGHEYESDHLSERYHRALTRLGGAAVKLSLEKPELFRR